MSLHLWLLILEASITNIQPGRLEEVIGLNGDGGWSCMCRAPSGDFRGGGGKTPHERLLLINSRGILHNIALHNGVCAEARTF